MITFPPEIYSSYREAGYAIGLKSFDTDIPVNWINAMVEQSKLVSGKKDGIYPRGWVWCYDASPIFGEPVPVTEGARMYAKFMAINPRVYEGVDW